MHLRKTLWPNLLLTTLLAITCAQRVRAQAEEAWTQFSVKAKQEEHYGYKNQRGQMTLPAKFGQFTAAQTFRHIIAVHEWADNSMYYLLKSGRAVGRDSVYLFDYTVDCESEGKIRFQDRRRNRVGFFDAQGRVAIPASYNYVTPFHNGLALALIGARQTCDGDDTLRCEHPGWAGGRLVLLNARNEVLVDSLTAAQQRSLNLNWYSLQINSLSPDTTTTASWRGVKGDQYTFVDYEKEFRRWLYDVFVPTVRAGNAAQVQALCFAEVAVAARSFRGWPQVTAAAFVAKYQASFLHPTLGSLQRGAPGVEIFDEDLNTLIFTGRAFQPFLTDCGRHFKEKYPIFNLVLTYPAQPATAPIEHQKHVEFIRTASGYRLFSVSL